MFEDLLPFLILLAIVLIVPLLGAIDNMIRYRNTRIQKRHLITQGDDTSFLEESSHPAVSVRVFLCHSSKDKPSVRRYYDRLRQENGVEPWLDEVSLLPGVDWDIEIRSAVRSSDVVLVFLSKYSINKEGYIQKEIKQALDIADEKPEKTIFIIPLRLEKCEVPDRLKRWQWLDLFEDGSYEKLLRSLLKRKNDIIEQHTRSS